MCAETTFGNYPSPDGRYVAQVFQVDCGATSAFNRGVRLRDRRWWMSWRSEDTVFSKRGEEPLIVVWRSGTSLFVGAHAAGTVYQEATEWHDVHIAYELPSEEKP
jgi:hypothetical protein